MRTCYAVDRTLQKDGSRLVGCTGWFSLGKLTLALLLRSNPTSCLDEAREARVIRLSPPPLKLYATGNAASLDARRSATAYPVKVER